jgi:hypothetical protein
MWITAVSSCSRSCSSSASLDPRGVQRGADRDHAVRRGGVFALLGGRAPGWSRRCTRGALDALRLAVPMLGLFAAT